MSAAEQTPFARRPAASLAWFALRYFLWPPLAWRTRYALPRGFADWTRGWFHYVWLDVLVFLVWRTYYFAADGNWPRALIPAFFAVLTAANLYRKVIWSYEYERRYLRTPNCRSSDLRRSPAQT